MDRCTGHCCRQFFLPVRPGELAERAAEENDSEIRTVARMAIPIAREDWQELCVTDDCEAVEAQGGWMYTCKNFDTVAGNCTIYETRPNMCRDYPYGRACRYRECTSSVRTPEGARIAKYPALSVIDESVKTCAE